MTAASKVTPIHTAAESLAAALAQLQSEMPHVGKDETAKAGTFTYSYADLTACTAALYPVLSRLGLSFSAKPTMTEHGFVLAYILRHTSGESDSGEYPLPDPTKAKAQDLGSAITYARRYSLCAVTGLAPGGDDDDGKAATERGATAAPRTPVKTATDPLRAAKEAVAAAGKAKGLSIADLADEFVPYSGGGLLAEATTDELVAFAAYIDKAMAPAGAS